MDEEIIIPDLDAHRQEVKKPKEDKRTGFMVTTIIMFFVGICFFAITMFYVFSIFLAKDQTSAAVGFIIYIFTLGWVTYIPAVVLSIIGICMGAAGIKSTKKANKVVSIIFLVLNSLVLTATVFIGFALLLFPSVLQN